MIKFIDHPKQWNNLKHPVPVRYFESLRIDFEVLEFTLEFDKVDYVKKLHESRHPKKVNVKSGPVVLSYDLPDLDEHEAISYIQQELRKAFYLLTYMDFLTVEIFGEKPVYY
ncbi:MAG: hypothetical protein ACOWWR_17410 [Eubacteriales bacterium]